MAGRAVANLMERAMDSEVMAAQAATIQAQQERLDARDGVNMARLIATVEHMERERGEARAALNEMLHELRTVSERMATMTAQMEHAFSDMRADVVWGRENRARIELLERDHVSRAEHEKTCGRVAALENWRYWVLGVGAAVGALMAYAQHVIAALRGRH